MSSWISGYQNGHSTIWMILMKTPFQDKDWVIKTWILRVRMLRMKYHSKMNIVSYFWSHFKRIGWKRRWSSLNWGNHQVLEEEALIGESKSRQKKNKTFWNQNLTKTKQSMKWNQNNKKKSRQQNRMSEELGFMIQSGVLLCRLAAKYHWLVFIIILPC